MGLTWRYGDAEGYMRVWDMSMVLVALFVQTIQVLA